jgi:tight adherence protein B
VRVIALGAGAAAAAAVVLLGAGPPARRVPGRPVAPSRLIALDEVVAGGGRLLDRLHPARRRARRDAQLPDALDRLAAALRAGQAIGPALVEMAPQIPAPLGTELEPIAAGLEHGASVASVLAGWATREGASADVRLVAAALTLGAEAGGEVARAVDRVAATLRERRELRGEVRALATQARASATVLAVAPLAFTGLVVTIEPGVVAFLVTTPVGLACLILGIGLEAIGAWWMARITQSAA